jgi:serine/threonine-protein kinase
MATVYLARVTARAGFDRFVALKRIHPHLLKEPGFVEMFLDEARVASRIVHPNVCSVLDYEAQGDRHYIAMEYLMGEPLSRVSQAQQSCTDGPSVERACQLVARTIADACEGLHAAHELRDSEGELLNVVHRDVSPQNLFLTYDGAVKVVDFGLVRTAQGMHKTKTGIIKGKFAYLAPEALASKALDRRSDIWGLGVVLWELITRRRLFQRDNEADTVLAAATHPIPPPSTVRAGIPVQLDPIVLNALARDPEERYATARDLGRDLVRFIHRGAEPVGLPDLAEWMDRLFPGGHARKLQLLEMAAQMGSELPTMIIPRGALPSVMVPTNDGSVVDTRAAESLHPVAHDCPTPSGAMRLRGPASATIGALALIVIGSVGITFLRARNDGEAATGGPAQSNRERASLLSLAPERSLSSDPAAESNHCAPDHRTYILEVVPTRDGDPPRMVLRAVPRDVTRP